MPSPESTEPFPSLPQAPHTTSASASLVSLSNPARSGTEPVALRRTTTSSSGLSRRTRTSSLTQSFLNSNPPFGMWQATGEVASKIPTLGEIRNGSFCVDGWTEEGQMQGRGETPHQIQRRKMSRASSMSASRHRRSTASPLSSRVDERDEFFPPTTLGVSDEADRVPSTIPETSRLETMGLNG